MSLVKLLVAICCYTSQSQAYLWVAPSHQYYWPAWPWLAPAPPLPRPRVPPQLRQPVSRVIADGDGGAALCPGTAPPTTATPPADYREVSNFLAFSVS